MGIKTESGKLLDNQNLECDGYETVATYYHPELYQIPSDTAVVFKYAADYTKDIKQLQRRIHDLYVDFEKMLEQVRELQKLARRFD